MSKSDLVDRILSPNFTGDLREIAADPNKVKIARPKPHVVALEIDNKKFLLTIHRPKPEEARLKAKQRWAERKNAAAGKPVAAKPAVTPLGRYG